MITLPSLTSEYPPHYETHMLHRNGMLMDVANQRRGITEALFDIFWPNNSPKHWRKVIENRHVIEVAFNLSKIEATRMLENIHNLYAYGVRFNIEGLRDPTLYLVPSDDREWNVLYDMRYITRLAVGSCREQYGHVHTASARFRRELKRGTIVVQNDMIYFRGQSIPPNIHRIDMLTLYDLMAHNEQYEIELFDGTDIDSEVPHLNHTNVVQVAQFLMRRVGPYVLPERLKDVLVDGFKDGRLSIKEDVVCFLNDPIKQWNPIMQWKTANMKKVLDYYGLKFGKGYTIIPKS